jgi:hypothetical protein
VSRVEPVGPGPCSCDPLGDDSTLPAVERGEPLFARDDVGPDRGRSAPGFDLGEEPLHASMLDSAVAGALRSSLSLRTSAWGPNRATGFGDTISRGRMASPEEVAEQVLFLRSDAAALDDWSGADDRC